MRLFRKSAGPHALAIAMVGVKLGDRLLQIGCENVGLVAALAAPTGLSGEAVAVDAERERVEAAASAAARAGVLVDVRLSALEKLPFENGAFDLAVIGRLLASLSPESRVGCLQEVRRVLRPGGRCVVIDILPRSGLGALFARTTPDPHYPGATRALTAEGFSAVRVLAEREGQRFVEGIQ